MKLLLTFVSLFVSVLSLPAPILIAAPHPDLQIQHVAASPSPQTASSSLPTPTLASATSLLPGSADAPLPTEKPELKARQTIIGGGGGGGYTITDGSGPGWPGWPGYPGGGETVTLSFPGGEVITLTAPPLSVTLGPW